MAKYECERCGAECNTTNPPHLCKDLKKRYERQQKAVDRIVPIIKTRFSGGTEEDYEEVALDIIRAISGLDLETT